MLKLLSAGGPGKERRNRSPICLHRHFAELQHSEQYQTTVRSPTERSDLRWRADRAYRKYRAILILANRLTPLERRRLDDAVVRLPSLPRRQVQEVYTRIRAELGRLETEVGAIADLETYEDVLLTPGAEPGTQLYIPKWYIQSSLFTRYERVAPGFENLPRRARIAVDTLGNREERQAPWHLLEAQLFEDMAKLWNLALEQHAGDDAKAAGALMRACTRSIFHFLEGLMNGVAEEVWLERGEEGLSAVELDKIREWDSKRQRRQMLSLRDKILQYPKIALKQLHPPLNEANCEELALLLEAEAELRHPLVHPTSRVSDGSSRDHVFLELKLELVGRLLDAAISFASRLGELLQRNPKETAAWLFSRGEDGRFPEKTFA